MMQYDPNCGKNVSYAGVVLTDDDAAKRAIEQLDGAALFDRTIQVGPYYLSEEKHPSNLPDFNGVGERRSNMIYST